MLEIPLQDFLPQQLRDQAQPDLAAVAAWAAAGEEPLQRRLLATTYPAIDPEHLDAVEHVDVVRGLTKLFTEYGSGFKPPETALGRLCLMHEHLNGRSDAETVTLLPAAPGNNKDNLRTIRHRMQEKFRSYYPDFESLLSEAEMLVPKYSVSRQFVRLLAQHPATPCRREPAVFDIDARTADTARATALCRGHCPAAMAEACLIEGILDRDSEGVWGGLTETARDTYRREHPDHPLVRNN